MVVTPRRESCDTAGSVVEADELLGVEVFCSCRCGGGDVDEVLEAGLKLVRLVSSETDVELLVWSSHEAMVQSKADSTDSAHWNCRSILEISFCST